MTVELVRLALRAVMAATPSGTLWLGLISVMATAGALALLCERCRRRTYIAVLAAIQPGTLLLDRAHHGKITVVRLPQPRLMSIEHSDSTGAEDPR